VAEQVLASGVALVGLATALAYAPDLPKRWQREEAEASPPAIDWKDKAIAALATMATTRRQLHRMGAGRAPKQQPSARLSLLLDRAKMRRMTKRYRAWRSAHA
jgi:hypothetical protein